MNKNISRFISTLAAAAMVVPMAACGSSSEAAASTAAAAAGSAASDVSGSAEGSVLNIQAWNEEFKSRMEDHYPGYQKVDDTTGKIGDVTVKWTITPSDD
ncbi:MAG: hypothetical protein PUC87_02845, partial [Galactobacillus timonensis]|nr:hypothetical protein [Galactobacillus timonensis]